MWSGRGAKATSNDLDIDNYDVLLFNEPIKSLRYVGRGIGHGNYRAIAGDVCKGLPARVREGIGVAQGVILAEFALNRDQKVAVHGGWRKEDGRRTNPKTALDGKARAAWHGGQWLGDGAAQLKARTATESCAAASNHAAHDGEPRAALRLRGRQPDQQAHREDNQE